MHIPVDNGSLLVNLPYDACNSNLNSVDTCDNAVIEDASALGEQRTFYEFATLVCQLMFVPEW